MTKEKFLLVSLSEPKAKELAQAVSNETCRKILEYLADSEATESQLAESLQLPISTVHYNLQLLQQSGLVVSEEYHYSKKGKEVNHYKLANKYIIIAPKSTYGIKERLKSILPVALIAGVIGAVLRVFPMLGGYAAAPVLRTAEMAAAPVADNMLKEAATDAMVYSAPAEIVRATSYSEIALWFIIGALFALGAYLLIDWIRNRNK